MCVVVFQRDAPHINSCRYSIQDRQHLPLQCEAGWKMTAWYEPKSARFSCTAHGFLSNLCDYDWFLTTFETFQQSRSLCLLSPLILFADPRERSSGARRLRGTSQRNKIEYLKWSLDNVMWTLSNILHVFPVKQCRVSSHLMDVWLLCFWCLDA